MAEADSYQKRYGITFDDVIDEIIRPLREAGDESEEVVGEGSDEEAYD